MKCVKGTIMELSKKVLAKLLHIANSDPPITRKKEFYEIKDAILKKHGTLVGHQVQHIKKPCRACGGTGIFRGYDNGFKWVKVDGLVKSSNNLIL